MVSSRPVPAPEPVVRLLPQLVDFAAARYGASPFLLRHTAEGWTPTSYTDAARAVHAFTALLEKLGVKPGDRVGIQSENRPEWGLAYLAVLETGAVIVPIDAQLQAQEVAEILVTAEARFCVVSARLRGVVEAARRERVPDLRLVSLDPIPGEPSWDEAQRSFPDERPREPRAEPGDLAVLLFTSGTTGHAKGVMLSHSNLLSNVEAVARAFEFGPADRFLSVLPLHHTFESTGGFLCPMRVGASVAYARGLNSRELREDMASSKTTLFIAVPLLYEKLLNAIQSGIRESPLPRRWLVNVLLFVTRVVRAATGVRLGRTLLKPLRERAGLASLRIFVSGAAPLAPEVFWGLLDLGLPVVEGYGLTETSPVACANRLQHPEPGGVGWPVPGVEVRIVEPDAEGNGEIAIRGPNVMIGYYGNPAGTAEVLRDGWFFTGDLGRFLPDGRVKITGRLKNMIATAAGKKIYPEEVETHLANSPFILEVVVTGGRSAHGDREEVHAHVHPNLAALEAHAKSLGKPFDDAFVERVLREDIEARCATLAPYKRVKRVLVHREEFAKTTTGKIRRHDLPSSGEESRRAAAS